MTRLRKYDVGYHQQKNAGVEMRKLSRSRLNSIAEPETKLALALLFEAKKDASRGDLSALAFLLTDGVRLADLIVPQSLDTSTNRANHHIVKFCKGIWANVQSGKLQPRWADKELRTVFTLFGRFVEE